VCLILFALGHHPRYPLIIAANRDESYRRPTNPLGFWAHSPDVAGGQDLEAGGSWLGITRQGRWAALTNYRQAGSYREGAPSRGKLVSNYLEGTIDPQAYAEEVALDAADYNGFNLIVADKLRAFYISNRTASPMPVTLGLHGLSNHLLDTPWPKVTLGVRALRDLPDEGVEEIRGALFDALAVRAVAADRDLPNTGVGVPGERILSPPFIAAESYGTRASTVILLDDEGHVSIRERAFSAMGILAGTTPLDFTLESDDNRARVSTLDAR